MGAMKEVIRGLDYSSYCQLQRSKKFSVQGRLLFHEASRLPGRLAFRRFSEAYTGEIFAGLYMLREVSFSRCELNALLPAADRFCARSRGSLS